jgi:hypothetical protein
MKELIFVGRSEDNLELIFMDEDGGEFAVAVDDHIRRSINTNDTATVTTTDSGISPRDIQTRIRRGETAEAIAAEAGVDTDRIERYAGPVLAERSYMAKRAAETLVRRPHGEVVLGELATGQLANRGIDTLTLVWDSYRRDDSRWTVTVSWASGSGGGIASWIFDPLAKSIVALDDEARWLFDEATGATAAATKAEEPKPRLVGLPTVSEPEAEELEPPAWAGPGHPTMPVPMPVASTPAPAAAPAPVAAVDDSPSWDDILFGHRPNDQ